MFSITARKNYRYFKYLKQVPIVYHIGLIFSSTAFYKKEHRS